MMSKHTILLENKKSTIFYQGRSLEAWNQGGLKLQLFLSLETRLPQPALPSVFLGKRARQGMCWVIEFMEQLESSLPTDILMSSLANDLLG